MFIGAVGIGAFVAALVALILAPQQIRRAARRRRLPVDARPDTAPFIAALAHARTRLGAADSSLAAARAHAAVAADRRPSTRSIPRSSRSAIRVASAVNDLDALLTRVETAPLTASYRALAESPQLVVEPARQGAARFARRGRARPRGVRNRGRRRSGLRRAHGAHDGDRPRRFKRLAQERREALRQQFAQAERADQPRKRSRAAPAVDTAAWIAERDSAQSLVGQATTALTDARQTAARIRPRGRARARGGASSTRRRWRCSPRRSSSESRSGLARRSPARCDIRASSDEHELERMTGARVLATVRPRPRNPGPPSTIGRSQCAAATSIRARTATS